MRRRLKPLPSKNPDFLTLAEVVQIHSNQIELYGGRPGIRELGLLQSALAQPEMTFQGEWLHAGLFQMAAGYAFHISRNHPFIDGNKRTALASALVFLELNGVSIEDPKGALLEHTRNLSSGKMAKSAFADVLKRLA